MEFVDLEREVISYHPEADIDLIRRAYDYAAEAHKNQKRNSGEPYIIHPLHVAMILAELKMDDQTICAGLLHDVIEDTPITLDEMKADFGEEIAYLVDGVTKLKKLSTKSKFDNQVDNYRKMVVAMARDIRVIIVKLADRLHNLRTLDYNSREKQIEKASETLEIYVPIAARLGMYSIKSELEDLCLKYLNPEAYYEIAELVQKKLADRKDYIKEIEDELARRLEELCMNYQIQGRPKTLYSIYKKMYMQDKSFDQIFDVTAIRVIVDTVQDCYTVLGVVHTMWKPIPKRFKDYIAMPKPNMYQSLHTTVIGPEGEIFEVQVRTWEMHRTAEYGIAAHWRYKEGKRKSTDFDNKLSWVRQLMEWQKTAPNSQEYMQTLKSDFFSDKIYILSPKGDVVELPAGATPVDFAYHIHSEVGNHCVGAKVDGRLVPLNTRLEMGNIVEIITSPNSVGPSRDWLNFVKSHTAKNRIRQFFKSVNRQEYIELGRDMIEEALKKEKLPAHEILSEENLKKVAQRLDMTSSDDLLTAVGFGTQSLGSVLSKLRYLYEQKQEEERKKNLAQQLEEERVEEDKRGEEEEASSVGDNVIRIKGNEDLTNMSIKFAQCCKPIPGDAIVGYITRGHGISIHRKNCPNVVNSRDPDRLIPVIWDQPESSGFYVSLKVIISNRTGYLTDLTELIARYDVDIATVSAYPNSKDHTYHISLTVRVQDNDQLQALLRDIRKIPNTLEVFRLQS